MRKRRARMSGKKEFKQAAVAYALIKLVIVFLTIKFVSCNGCDTQLLRHAVHLIIFTHFIWAGMRITSTVIATICIARGTAYMVNFFFKTTLLLHLPITGQDLALFTEEGAGNWVFALNALLMYAIAAMILRAVKARLKGRVEEVVAETPPEKLKTLKHA